MNIPHEPRLARLAAVLTDPARSRMLAGQLGVSVFDAL
jgi:hypothetical protein